MNQALILCPDPYSQPPVIMDLIDPICVPRARDRRQASKRESKLQLSNYYQGSPSCASVSHHVCDIGLRACLGSGTYNMTLLDLDLSSLSLSFSPKLWVYGTGMNAQ